MAGLIIVKPLAFSVAGYMANAARVATPDPKESAVNGTTSANSLNIDLGASQPIDTVFIGYTLNGGSNVLTLATGVSGYDETARGPVAPAPTDATGWRHYLYKATVPFNARYLTISIPAVFGSTFSVGVVAVGLAFQPQWGHEYGSGRTIEDTGSAERLFGGGFGIDEGVAASGYQWTFGDLQPLELRQLYQLVKDRRTTRSVLVVEDPDQTDGLNERIHWSLFDRLDAYERIDPLNSRWALKIRDWA